jgi:hypothetical protein
MCKAYTSGWSNGGKALEIRSTNECLHLWRFFDPFPTWVLKFQDEI